MEKEGLGGFQPKPPTKEQVFTYQFAAAPRDGDYFIRLQDLTHAIGNSDQYPEPIFSRETPAEKTQAAVLDAVFAAIESTPRYVYYKGKVSRKERKR